MDPLLLRGPLDADGEPLDSSAFRVEVMPLARDDGAGGLEWRDIAFVVDFAGGLEAFDVTDLLTSTGGPDDRRHVGYQPPGQPQSPHAWQPPIELREGRTTNCYDLALLPSESDSGVVDVYLATSRLGVYVIRYDVETGFTPPEHSVGIKTPGEPHTVQIRDLDDDKLLLVSDHSGGTRFYGRQ